MIKILVVSDSHKNRGILKRILMKEEADTHLFFHCGDSMLHGDQLFPFSSVKGNCDLFVNFPKHIEMATPLGLVYITHGEMGIERFPKLIRTVRCDILLYGHTHVHRHDYINDCHCFNPGSVTEPRDGTSGTYLVIEGTCRSDIKWEFRSVDDLPELPKSEDKGVKQ